MAINFKVLEKIIKGVANHWRLRTLFLLYEEPNISLIDIASKLDGNFKTISEHTKKLYQSGLIEKRYKGQIVLHSISVLGDRLLSYLKKVV